MCSGFELCFISFLDFGSLDSTTLLDCVLPNRLTIACLNLIDIEPRYEPGDRTRQFNCQTASLSMCLIFQGR